jgi:hypothetical protein
VVGTPRCLGLLPLQRLPELALGVVFGCISHDGSVARPPRGRRVLYRLPGGIPYTWAIGSVSSTRRSSTMARR